MIVAILGAGRIGEIVAKRLAASSNISKIVLTKRNIATIQYLKSDKIEVTTDNTYAAIIAESITAYSINTNISDNDMHQIHQVFDMIGEHIMVPEKYMDAITALSGSGPAYIAILVEALVTAGLKVGLPRDVAMKLTTKTLSGTANLLELTKMHPAELRDTVTTPSGTTIAGIYELEKGSFRTSIINAVEAATFAAERVSKKFEDEF